MVVQTRVEVIEVMILSDDVSSTSCSHKRPLSSPSLSTATAAALFRGEASVTSALISKTSAESRRGEDAEWTNRGEGALQIEL
ncbi:hypothetical protein MHYP_G00115360 [Metynnis hypsauchen]